MAAKGHSKLRSTSLKVSVPGIGIEERQAFLMSPECRACFFCYAAFTDWLARREEYLDVYSRPCSKSATLGGPTMERGVLVTKKLHFLHPLFLYRSISCDGLLLVLQRVVVSCRRHGYTELTVSASLTIATLFTHLCSPQVQHQLP